MTTSRSSSSPKHAPAKKFKAGSGKGGSRDPFSPRATKKARRGKPPSAERPPKPENS
ncbi:MAG TPA: hypothetical protein VHO24_04975 [Opitutaceae bacterium]|nr:hypothetical protein [Opitutaceae bacterium]